MADNDKKEGRIIEYGFDEQDRGLRNEKYDSSGRKTGDLKNQAGNQVASGDTSPKALSEEGRMELYTTGKIQPKTPEQLHEEDLMKMYAGLPQDSKAPKEMSEEERMEFYSGNSKPKTPEQAHEEELMKMYSRHPEENWPKVNGSKSLLRGEFGPSADGTPNSPDEQFTPNVKSGELSQRPNTGPVPGPGK